MLLIILCLLVIGSLVVNLLVGINPGIQESDLLANCIILPSAFIIFLLILSKRRKANGIKDFNFLLAVSFVIRVLFMYWDRYYRYIFTFPNSGLDTGSFDFWARDFIANDMSGYNGYASVLGWIYTFYYPNTLWGQFINVIVSIICILVFYKIICLLKIDPKYKFYGVLLICFLPNYLIMSSILLRESLITTLLAISIYYLLKWWYQGNWFNLAISMVSVLAATYLHSGVIAYAVAIYIIVAFGGSKQRNFSFKSSTVSISIIAITLFMFIYNNYGDVFFLDI